MHGAAIYTLRKGNAGGIPPNICCNYPEARATDLSVGTLIITECHVLAPNIPECTQGVSSKMLAGFRTPYSY